MGFYNDVHGEIKIEPELTTDEINYFRGRFRSHILSFAWKNWADTEGEATKMANEDAQKYIKMERITIGDPYRGININYLEFIAKMFQNRASGQLKICSSTTYGDPKVNGGWTNDVTTVEFKDGKVTIERPTTETSKKTETEPELPSVLTIGGNVVQTGDLTLLKYNKELRSLGFYHAWKVNGEELKDDDSEEIVNLADNEKCYSIPYFDGTQNNFLFIKGGLVTTLNSVSETVNFGNSGASMTTEQVLLDETYGKECYKIVNLPYLRGTILNTNTDTSTNT